MENVFDHKNNYQDFFFLIFFHNEFKCAINRDKKQGWLKKLCLVFCVLQIQVKLIAHLFQQSFMFCQISGFKTPVQINLSKNSLNRVTDLRKPIQGCFISMVDMHVGKNQAIKFYIRVNSVSHLLTSLQLTCLSNACFWKKTPKDFFCCLKNWQYET